MASRIEIERAALKDLDGIDRPVRERILRFLTERVAPLDEPRSIGEALKGDTLGTLWKYRVGDFRIIASIRDAVERRPRPAVRRPPGLQTLQTTLVPRNERPS